MERHCNLHSPHARREVPGVARKIVDNATPYLLAKSRKFLNREFAQIGGRIYIVQKRIKLRVITFSNLHSLIHTALNPVFYRTSSPEVQSQEYPRLQSRELCGG